MFKDNKLRLLMNLVGFERLGEHHDPDAAWIIPSSLTSTQLQEAIDLIRKFEFDPPTYEDGKAPEDLLRSKAAAARRSTRRAEFDDDSDGIDRDLEDEDHGEYAKGGPTTRDADTDVPRKTLKRRRRQKTPVELDEEEQDRRAEARRKKEIEKQAKALSTMYVHDSDDEDWDAEKDAAFFAREQAIREENLKVFKKSLVLGTVEPAVSVGKKRKADATVKKSKRSKKKALFEDSDDDMEDAESSQAASVTEDNEDENEDGEGTTDTPLSSQNANAMTAESDTDTPRKSASSSAKAMDTAMAEADTDDDEDDAPVARRAAPRNTRAGFVIDSDSE